jgi:hypothetical protein
MESYVIARPRWNSCYLLARFVKSFYVKDCICENQEEIRWGLQYKIKLVTLYIYSISLLVRFVHGIAVYIRKKILV